MQQLNINTVEMSTLRKRVDLLDDMKSSFRQIDDLTSKLNASVSELKKSTDQNHTRFITSIHENQATGNSNAKQIEELWKAMAKMKELDES
jgi:uncharacterized protein YoxC